MKDVHLHEKYTESIEEIDPNPLRMLRVGKKGLVMGRFAVIAYPTTTTSLLWK